METTPAKTARAVPPPGTLVVVPIERGLPTESSHGWSVLWRAMWRSARDRLTDRSVVAHGGAVSDFTCCHCGAHRAKGLFATAVPEAKGYRPVRCDGCHLVATHPMPAPVEIPAFYESAYYGVENAKFGALTEFFVHLFRRSRVRALGRAGIRDGRVLDVGCARGLFLSRLARLGYEVHGTELSAESARGARARLGTPRVRVGTLRECAFDAGMFMGITAWQVFEHLPDPGATLDECHRILEPGGALILAVPNVESWQARWSGAEWFHLDVPRHLYHYSPATLTRLLESHGFRVERVTHQNMEQDPFGLLQSALHRLGRPFFGLYELLRGSKATQRTPPLRRAVYFAAYLAAFPFACVMSWIWSCLGSGASFTVYARRDRTRDRC